MSICGYINRYHCRLVISSFLATFPLDNNDKNILKVLDIVELFPLRSIKHYRNICVSKACAMIAIKPPARLCLTLQVQFSKKLKPTAIFL